MSENKTSSNRLRPRFIRLLIVLAVAFGFAIYSYGWQVTEIEFDKPQEERRQTNVQNALRELLSPRIFEQAFEIIQIEANFLMECGENREVEQPEMPGGASISITPDCGEPGDIVTVEVKNFEPQVDARIRWIPPEGQSRPREILEIGREEFLLDATGSFGGQIEVPRIRGGEGQIHQIAMRAAIPSGPIMLSKTTENVIRRMVETIFMALVATSIAIPVAALISFLAARNLMRPIRLSLGKLLVAFNALAIGFALGGKVFTDIGALGVSIGKATDMSPLWSFVVPVVVAAGAIILVRLSDKIGRDSLTTQIQSALLKLFMMLVIVFLTGALGGLAILIGDQITIAGNNIRPDWIQQTLRANNTVPPLAPDDWFMNGIGDGIASIGNVLTILGTLVELFIGVIAAVAGAYLLATIASSFFTMPLRQIPSLAGHIVTGILGLTGGAILMGVVGIFGSWAALLGLLSPIIAGILGGAIFLLAYERFVPQQNKRKRQFEISHFHRMIHTIVFALGAIILFIVTYNILNIERAVVNGTRPSVDAAFILNIETSLYVLQNTIIGAILGGIGGAIAGVRTTFPLGTTLYNVSRALLNTVRSIEPLIMGLVFVIWVGIGPFAGVLALTLHSIAALGKLYSEQIENIDEGPIEAVQSTGANWLQTVVYAVVPQIIPPYIAFTMYRWDINVRMSTIIGFVGGGGIGLLLQQQINLLQYRDAGVAVLAIAVVVSILDYASASIRERLI